MPITPRYNLTQTPTHVSIHVSIPHVRVSPKTLELIVDGCELHLYAPPTYLLKLVLPADVVDEQLYGGVLGGDSFKNEDNSGASRHLVEEVSSESNPLVQSEAADDSTAVAQDTPDITNANTNTNRAEWTEDDLPKMQYDPLQNHGTIIIILRKVQDEIWDDLDLLGRLQHPLHKKKASPMISSVCNNDNGMLSADNSNGIMEELKSIHKGTLRYGLFQNYSNVFTDYAREGLADEMLECPNPDVPMNTHEGQEDNDDHHLHKIRREMRLDTENSKFDQERYLGDATLQEGDDMIYDSAIAMVTHWSDSTSCSANTMEPINVEAFIPYFTQEESHLLATLKPVEIPNLSKSQTQSVLLALSDLLFAYTYDYRTTDGESTIESSWTIMILSPSLSWLECYNAPYDSISDVMNWCVRRSLIYPYLRSYSLAMKIVRDVFQLLMSGRRVVLRCLLKVHTIMEKSEAHYLFNKLYVDPMIWWVQKCDDATIHEFGVEMGRLLMDNFSCTKWNSGESNMNKQYLGLGLVELEKAMLESEEDSSSDSDETCSGSSDSSHDTNICDADAQEKKVIELLQSSLEIRDD
eukprot:scaffold15773_cov75-Cyclotella_meneghiniana.AAC.9